MGRVTRGAIARLAAVPVVIAVGACFAACGSETDGGQEGGKGGSITIAQTSQPDFLDPALGYTANSWEPTWVVYTPLMTYKHANGAEGAQLIPGLADAEPKLSNGNKTYTFTLRKNLKYSNGEPVQASDFEHSIKRVLNLESGGTAFFEAIEGADAYVKAGKAKGDISGIEADDKTGKIVIALNEPDGSFLNVLATPFAALVPSDTPFENQTKTPAPGVGAYKLTKSVPNREFVLEKNARFNLPGIPKGNLDKITTKIVKNAQRQAQDVIAGKLDYMQDPPPADIKPEVKAKYSDRYREIATASTYYFFLNSRVAPFDKKEVREAVNIGLDKPAIARLFAGELTPGCSFLPPGMPGYDEKLDTTECPFGDPSKKPDLPKARKMIKDAGVAGAKIAVWGNNDDPTDRVTEAYADQLNKMGFEATPKIVDGGVYFQTVGNEKTRAQTGFDNLFQDFPSPNTFMSLVDGKSIQPTNSKNLGNTDDPEITKGIAELSREPRITTEIAARWTDLNTKLVERGWAVPYGHSKLATFFSERMDFENCNVFSPVYNNDYSSFCLKK